ncbi:MAG: DUF2156 domain-containing protein [Promethearchaeota archaeon]
MKSSIQFTQGKKITLKDKAIFDLYFKTYPPEISEFTFSNLFIWKNHYEYLYQGWKNHLLIWSNSYLKKWKRPISGRDALFFLPPIGKFPERIILEILSENINIEFHRVPESIKGALLQLKESNKLNIDIIEDRNNWDYVYDKKELLSLTGNRLRQKRRNLQKFLSSYKHEFFLINEKNIESCKQLQIEWCDANECQSNEDLQEEQNAIFDAFDNFQKLLITGGALFVDDKCIAYTIGEKLNEKTTVIHIEKAYADYEGSYQAINNFFIKNCCTSTIFVNREQDLGIQGLRYAKMSYKPHHMVKKYIISRIT